MDWQFRCDGVPTPIYHTKNLLNYIYDTFQSFRVLLVWLESCCRRQHLWLILVELLLLNCSLKNAQDSLRTVNRRSQVMRKRSGVSSRRMSRGQPKRIRILLMSKHMRRWHLNNPWSQPLLILNYAAVIIQKIARGYFARNRKDVAPSRRNMKRRAAVNYQLDKYLDQLDYYKSTRRRRPEWLDDGFSSWCAVQIQSYWRMHRTNQRYLQSKMMIYQIAAMTVQSSWRVYQYNQYYQTQQPFISVEDLQRRSAFIIQSCWRSFCARRIFRYFSDLILFKLRGAPVDLLRSIIPNESSFLDSASGTHVRFRLGGHSFPPGIYFKLYTHRPLCDINSFAPRDYSKEKKSDGGFRNSAIGNGVSAVKRNGTDVSKIESLRRREGGGENIKVGSKYFGVVVTTTVDMDHWYRRVDSNPWRPIASQIMSDLVKPPWCRDEISQPVVKTSNHFHFSRLKRQSDIDGARRRKKREWMIKAHLLAKSRDHRGSEDGTSEPRPALAADPHQYRHRSGNELACQIEERSRALTNRFDDSGQRVQELLLKAPCKAEGKDVETDMKTRYRYDYKGEMQRSRDTTNRHHDFNFLEEETDTIPGVHRGIGDTRDSKSNAFTGSKLRAEKEEYGCYHNPSETTGARSAAVGKTLDLVSDDSDLLKWSMALDFSEYTSCWHSMATSLPSDKENIRMKANKLHSKVDPSCRTLDIGSY